ncbi:MAG TPA: hypothetical protein ENH46_05280, partial [Candidatus Pacearchaeota archaeon]|nr:hypothetical protein [Candidatus Pacearchaeota archaeon]
LFRSFANQLENKKSKTGIEDKWITSKLNSTINKITEDYDNLKYPEAIQKLERFLVEDLSRTYIKIIRDRADEAKSILEKIIVDILKLLAPITPFITEHLWQDLKKKKVVKEESIHLSSWPKADKKKINVGLEKRMENILRIIEMGLAERDKAKIGLRWPLAKASISCDKGLDKDLQEIIKSQLNIKKVELKKAEQITVNLDTKLTPELESEGYAREMSRQVQAFRKKLGLEKKDRVELIISTDEKFKKTLESQKNFIKERTNSRRLEIVTTGKERFKNKVDFKIKDKRGNIEIIC